jgi:hypothetical protein
VADRFDPVIRGVIGLGVAACVVTAALLHPAPLPDQARTSWLRVSQQQVSGKHLVRYTFVVDTVQPGNTPQPFDDKPIAIAPGTQVAIRGWAFDPGLRRTADRFVYRIDGGSWHDSRYHIARPDVAIALGVPDAADSGFEVQLRTSALRAGRHTIELATIAKAYPPNRLPERVVIDVKA